MLSESDDLAFYLMFPFKSIKSYKTEIASVLDIKYKQKLHLE